MSDLGEKLSKVTLGFVATGIVLTAAITGHGKTHKNRHIEDKNKDREYECDIVSVLGGEISHDKEQLTKESCKDLKYNVAFKDDQDLVVYVYSENQSERELFADYIESKIYVTDEGKVLFDEKSISEADYNSYIAELELDQTNGTQRTRNNYKKEN